MPPPPPFTRAHARLQTATLERALVAISSRRAAKSFLFDGRKLANKDTPISAGMVDADAADDGELEAIIDVIMS